jgi:ABC-type sugar transport system permease subunit
MLPFWLLLPTVIFVAVIQVYPALYTVWLSVQQREPSGWIFVGLGNFKRLLSLSRFSESAGHTVVFLVGYASLTMLLGFLIALLLNRTTHLSGLYLTLIFIPWTIADLLAGVVIRLLVQPDYGLLTGILQNPSLFPPDGLSFLTDTRPPPWIGDFPFPPSPAMVLLILVATWRALPFVTLLMLAALQTVPSEILESSKIDGANEFQIARLILIPLMLPTMVVALSNLILTGMNGVGTVFSLTRGGPGSSTDVLSYMLYTTGWRELNFGRAASLALMIAAINLLLITGTLRLTRAEERSRQDG